MIATMLAPGFANAKSTVKAAAKPSLSMKQRDARLDHAKELLGNRYKKSTVRNGEKIKKINSLIYARVKERLPAPYQKKSGKVAQAIIDQAYKYKFDPIFLLSVIQSESSFRPRLFGSFGEIGLMQIKPSTAEWIAKKMDVKYKNENDLYDPVKNIRIGAAFLSYLRDRFDSHAQLYLSAYNMGQGNVDHAIEQNIWPKDYVERVMRQYVDFYAENAPAKNEKRPATAAVKSKIVVAKAPTIKAPPIKTSKRDIAEKQVPDESVQAAIATAAQTDGVVQDTQPQDNVVQVDGASINDPGLAPDLNESETVFN